MFNQPNFKLQKCRLSSNINERLIYLYDPSQLIFLNDFRFLKVEYCIKNYFE